MKKSLYIIQQEYQQIIDQVIESEGELTPETETALSINREEIEAKGVCYAMVVKELDYEIDIIDVEIKRLQAFKSSKSKAIDRLKQTLSGAMQHFEIEKLETPLIKISFRKSESVEITDIDQLPADYFTIKEIKTPSKDLIKSAIKAGEPMMGAELKTNKNIQIK